MALFDRKRSDENPKGKATEGNAVEPEKRQKELRSLSGFGSIDDVAKSAPSSTGGEPTTRTRTTGTAGRTTTPRQSAAELEAAKKAERRAIALEGAGKAILKKAASLPYETWAALAADPELKLSELERKELADTYYEIAQGFDIDFSNPWILLVGMAGMHVDLVATRIKHLNDVEKAKKDAEKAKANPATVVKQ